MHRRDILRSLFFGTSAAKSLSNSAGPVTMETEEVNAVTANSFKSKWHLLPRTGWAGEDLVAQDLQDWCIKNGELNCVTYGAERMVHVLSHQLSAGNNSFKVNFIFRFLDQQSAEDEIENFAGFRLGMKVRLQGHHTATPEDKGIDAGVTRNGHLFIGNNFNARKIDEKILTERIRLQLSVTPLSTGGNFAKLKALDNPGNTIATISAAVYDAIAWQGNVALISHFKTNKENTDRPTIAVSRFEIEGEKMILRLKNNPAAHRLS